MSVHTISSTWTSWFSFNFSIIYLLTNNVNQYHVLIDPSASIRIGIPFVSMICFVIVRQRFNRHMTSLKQYQELEQDYSVDALDSPYRILYLLNSIVIFKLCRLFLRRWSNTICLIQWNMNKNVFFLYCWLFLRFLSSKFNEDVHFY